MKINLLDNLPADPDRLFAVYRYDEALSCQDTYIDIRAIVAQKSESWLNDINESFARLSGRLEGHTRWWWATGASRIDLRPWGQEETFKPLFFARAVLEWLAAHPDVEDIVLVGVPDEVGLYLKEFEPDLVIVADGARAAAVPFIIDLLWHLLIGLLKSFKNAGHIFWNHVFYKKNFPAVETLVLYELISNVTLAEGYQYFYAGLFDDEEGKGSPVVFGCIDNPSAPVRKLRSQLNGKIFFLLDNMSLLDLVKAICINIYTAVLIAWACVREKAYPFGEYKTAEFWPRYLRNELARAPFLNAIGCYYALKNTFSLHKYKHLVYVYEEKALERAILFASIEENIPTTGYIPHPQHRLALSLRDTHEPYAPKPDYCAVCGNRYVGYFQSWCKKDPQRISVWGSQKSFKEGFVTKKYDRNDLKILLVLSHPNELSVFHSWLDREPRLAEGVTYYLRIYQAAGHRRFREQLEAITGKFDCVKKAEGDFAEDLKFCDLACFCATSAGLLAVNCGYISIHLCLDDFFAMNPCFDDLEEMLSCRNAAEFAGRLDGLCLADEKKKCEIFKNELDFVDSVFHPIQGQNAGLGTINARDESSVLCGSLNR